MTAKPAEAAAVRAHTVRRVTLVLGTSAGGIGAHVRMLAAGLTEQGIAVSVAGPPSADARFSFSALPSVSFSAVEISDRPRAGDLAAILLLRKLLLRPGNGGPHHASLGEGGGRPPAGRFGGGSPGRGGVVHAHGMRAGALAVLALMLCRGGRRPSLVVTVHNAPPGGLVSGLVYRLLERVVARGADQVLCVSPDLEVRMRRAGARRVARAVIAAPVACPNPADGQGSQVGDGAACHADGCSGGVRPAGRPVVFAAGRLVAQKGFAVLLEAASRWRDLEPMPLVVIAGDGPLAGELRARAVALGAAAVFLGHRDDVPARLAGAGVFVLPSYWEGQPLVLQEALRAGTPIVATRAGGIPDLTGEDAALLVPPGDAQALAAAVRSVLTDQALAARLRTAARARAAALPGAGDAVTAVLASYAAVIR